MTISAKEAEQMKIALAHSICNCADDIIDQILALDPAQLSMFCERKNLRKWPGETTTTNGKTYTYLIRDIIIRPVTKDDPVTSYDVVEFHAMAAFPEIQRKSLVESLKRLSKHLKTPIIPILRECLSLDSISNEIASHGSIADKS